jgi:hypothetical protein
MSWNRAHFGAWCIVSAPLILGLELTDEKLNPILDIIGNKAAVKVNQEWAGHPGMLVMNLIAPPQQATTGGKLLTVPTRSAGDFFTSNGAGISGGHGDAATSGASNIRTGGPGETSVIEMGTGIVGVAGAMELDSLSMSFRYTAGCVYTCVHRYLLALLSRLLTYLLTYVLTYIGTTRRIPQKRRVSFQ